MANCLHPVTIPNKGKGPAYIEVPCGKCPKCLATKLNKWVFRLKQHYKAFKFAYFVTLTYDDEHLPYSYVDNGKVRIMTEFYPQEFDGDDAYVPCLCKSHLQKFFRKIRKYYNVRFKETNILSYYAIGEYGPNPRDGKHDRPHYHVMLFSNLEDFSTAEKCQLTVSYFWDHGFIQVKPVTDFRIQYVCKHHLKPKNSKQFAVPQFTLRSNGLGLSFLDAKTAKWFNDNKPTFIFQRDGIKIGVPRYYRTKLLEMYGYDISSAYIQRKSFNKLLVEAVDRGDISTDHYERVLSNRASYERYLENQNLYKSKNKRK